MKPGEKHRGTGEFGMAWGLGKLGMSWREACLYLYTRLREVHRNIGEVGMSWGEALW